MFDLKVWHTSQPVFSFPVWNSCGFGDFSLDHKQIPKAFNRLTLVADFFPCSLCLPAPQEFDRRSPLPLHAVCCVSLLFFSLPLYVNGIYIVLLMMLFGHIEQLHFHQTFWYLNGIKQMRWVEHRLNGHWSGSVISTSTLHDVCYRIKETGILSIMGSAAAPSEWHGSELRVIINMIDVCHSSFLCLFVLCTNFYKCILLDVLTGVLFCNLSRMALLVLFLNILFLDI